MTRWRTNREPGQGATETRTMNELGKRGHAAVVDNMQARGDMAVICSLSNLVGGRTFIFTHALCDSKMTKTCYFFYHPNWTSWFLPKFLFFFCRCCLMVSETQESWDHSSWAVSQCRLASVDSGHQAAVTTESLCPANNIQKITQRSSSFWTSSCIFYDRVWELN